jgi:hypothetical protein
VCSLLKPDGDIVVLDSLKEGYMLHFQACPIVEQPSGFSASWSGRLRRLDEDVPARTSRAGRDVGLCVPVGTLFKGVRTYAHTGYAAVSIEKKREIKAVK